VFDVLRGVAEKQAAAHRARNAAYMDRTKAKPKDTKGKFKTSAALRAKRKYTEAAAIKCKFNDTSIPMGTAKVVFPPPPASQTLRHGVISDMCADFNPMQFEETGCAVCGRLCKLVDLTPMAEMDVDWDLLTAKDVTQTERFSSADPVTELAGPVLATECDHVCTRTYLNEKVHRGERFTGELVNSPVNCSVFSLSLRA
jgi:hypothetical protein